MIETLKKSFLISLIIQLIIVVITFHGFFVKINLIIILKKKLWKLLLFF